MDRRGDLEEACRAVEARLILTTRQARNYIERARQTRKNLGGVLLLLDGDSERVAGKEFCPVDVARMLTKAAREQGAGSVLSVSVVFLRTEYESLFLANHENLPRLKPGAVQVTDVEKKRGPKEWLRDHLADGYVNVSDQEPFTRQLDFALVRERMPSSAAWNEPWTNS